MMDGRVFINAEKHYSGVVGSKFLLIHIYIYCPPGEGSTQSCEESSSTAAGGRLRECEIP